MHWSSWQRPHYTCWTTAASPGISPFTCMSKLNNFIFNINPNLFIVFLFILAIVVSDQFLPRLWRHRRQLFQTSAMWDVSGRRGGGSGGFLHLRQMSSADVSHLSTSAWQVHRRPRASRANAERRWSAWGQRASEGVVLCASRARAVLPLPEVWRQHLSALQADVTRGSRDGGHGDGGLESEARASGSGGQGW